MKRTQVTVSSERPWPLDPRKRCIGVFFVSALAHLFFVMFEILSVVHSKYLGRTPPPKPKPRSIGERTLLRRTNSLNRQNSFDLLHEWHLRRSLSNASPSLNYNYATLVERLQSVIFNSVFNAHTKYLARVLLREQDIEQTANSMLEAVRRIQDRAKKSVKFRFAFKQLLSFLADVESSRISSVIEFLSVLANDMLHRPHTWSIALSHAQCKDRLVPALTFETTWAIYALFVGEGAGLGPHVLTALWTESNRSYYAAITLLMYSAIEKCVPGCEKEINVTERSGTERLLEIRNDLKVHPMGQLLGKRQDDMFKEKMMSYVMHNQLNEYVESSWSTKRLERAFWAMTCAMPFLEKSKFLDLEPLNAAIDVDLRGWDPLTLLSFSLSGMIRFSGEGDCVYQLTACPDARIKIQARLPRPTVNDLVTLRVLKTKNREQFMMDVIPGSDKLLEAHRIEGRLVLRESARTSTFIADMLERVG